MKGSKLSVKSLGAIKPMSFLFFLTHWPIEVRLPCPSLPDARSCLTISEPKKDSFFTSILLYLVSALVKGLTVKVVFFVFQMGVHNGRHVPEDAHHDDGQEGKHDEVEPVAS